MRLVSTRDARFHTTFGAAALGAAPADGGLWVPESLPRWRDVPALLDLPWAERSCEILGRLVGDEWDRSALDALVRDAFDFPVPVAALDERTHALELFHGPSLAFKDFGARFLARVVSASASGPRTVLTATSGDTGAAAAAAFLGRAGVSVAVLYPRGRVTPLQERQLACLGGNTRAFAVDGSFDDCQRMVRACFADETLAAALGLTSANSINIARLLAQVPYYFEGVARLREACPGRPIVVSVPSGNFGNLCAGLYARALGLPVEAFVAATNANRTVPDHLDTGEYRPRSSVATHSSAMDVGAPSNWERIRHLFGDDLDSLRAVLRWGSCDDHQTEAAMRALHAGGYVAEPHAAVAWQVLSRVLRPGECGLFLGTAHPAKFLDLVEPLLGVRVPLPASLAALLERPVRAEPLPANAALLAARLREGAAAGEGEPAPA